MRGYRNNKYVYCEDNKPDIDNNEILNTIKGLKMGKSTEKTE